MGIEHKQLPDNPWRESLENCIDGSNYLRCSEYHGLVAYIDGLLAERDAALADAKRLREALESVYQYGSDTLSGRAGDGGADDIQSARDEQWRAALAVQHAASPEPVTREQIYTAVVSCGHSIERESVTLFRDPRLPGNAASQLADRLASAMSPMSAQGERA